MKIQESNNWDYKMLMDELENVWEQNEYSPRSYSGIRSSQIAAVIRLLVEKGILKPDE